jgi:hypothetical protein
MIDPLWAGDVGTFILAAETGVLMFNNKKAATAPAMPTVVVNGMSGQDFMTGAILIAAAVILLAAALLAGAAIVHHGLVA